MTHCGTGTARLLASSFAGLVWLSACSAPLVDAPTDASSEPDAGAQVDAAADAGSASDAGRLRDAGTRPDATHDSGVAGRDGGPHDDGGMDGSTESSDAGADDGTDSSAAMPDAGLDSGAVDAGPPRPVGDPVDITGSRCALDSAGQFWCWGRWEPVEDVRRLGTGFDSAAGSCAMRGDELWCAEFSTLTMIQVTYGTDTLHVERIAEYSDLALGCGVRRVGEGYRSFCWTNGGHPVFGSVTEIGSSNRLAAVVAPGEPRTYIAGRGWRLTAAPPGTPEAYDINPPAPCEVVQTPSPRVVCSGYGNGFGFSRPPGEFRLGFGLGCSYADGVRCSTASTVFNIAAPDYADHAITYPIGTPVGDHPVSRITQVRGVCIAGDGIRCYTLSATLAYTVNW